MKDSNYPETEAERFTKKYGEPSEYYTGVDCPKCGRNRMIKYSKGFDICEKCNWCLQEKDYCEFEPF